MYCGVMVLIEVALRSCIFCYKIKLIGKNCFTCKDVYLFYMLLYFVLFQNCVLYWLSVVCYYGSFGRTIQIDIEKYSHNK
jgi:hypothetical protein